MNTVNEKPILFSGPMVEAILAGRKTQTRRVVKEMEKYFGEKNIAKVMSSPDRAYKLSRYSSFLWVKETFHQAPSGEVLFRAGYPGNLPNPKWKSSIFMPRKASRLLLKVTGVRLARLQDIRKDDALAEGIDWNRADNGTVTYLSSINSTVIHHSPQAAYRELWDSLNAKRGYGWDTNPLVWVVGFEVVNQ